MTFTTLKKVLKSTYPFLILTGALAAAGISAVQAGTKNHPPVSIQACSFVGQNANEAGRAPSCQE